MIWYIEFPTYRYNEDVKAIAKERGLKIIDSKFQGENEQCENAPTLTLVGHGQQEFDREALKAEAIELGYTLENSKEAKKPKAKEAE